MALTKSHYIYCIIGLWILVIGIILIACLIPAQQYKDYSFLASPGDTHVIVQGDASDFCSKVKLNSGGKFDIIRLWLLKESPQLANYHRQTIKNSDILDEHEYNSWHFYMFTDSYIRTEICFHGQFFSELYFFIVKGQKNFQTWKDNMYIDDAVTCGCYLVHEVVNELCNDEKFTYQYDISKDDDYFFILYNAINSFPYVYDAEFEVQRKTYDVSSATPSTGKTCTYQTPTCEVALDTFSSQSVVFKAEDHHFGLQETVNVDCVPRATTYVLIFSVTVITAAIITCILHMTWGKTIQRERANAAAIQSFQMPYFVPGVPYSYTGSSGNVPHTGLQMANFDHYHDGSNISYDHPGIGADTSAASYTRAPSIDLEPPPSYESVVQSDMRSALSLETGDNLHAQQNASNEAIQQQIDDSSVDC